jgi:hexokinase
MMTDDLRELGLTLTPEALDEVRAALRDRMREGLAVEGGEIAMLPAFVAPPDLGVRGAALALDAGGTNLRAARVRLAADGGEPAVEPVQVRPLPGAKDRAPATAREFFAAHVEVLEALGGAGGEALGYCFSYPITSSPDGDAVLNRWTKEVRVSDVEGARVGSLLTRHAAAADLSLGPVVVLNDTIATLMGGALAPGIDPRRAVGLIVGTGTNLGAFLPVASIPKLARDLRWPASHMAVNFESGAARPPHLSPVDEALDKRSLDPGRQRFEKAVSGAYLGPLFAEACRQLGLEAPPRADQASEVARLAERDHEGAHGALARALILRAADLVAAALAATHDLIGGDGDLGVCAEGTMFTKAPGFAARVDDTLAAMLAGDGARGRFRTADNTNLIGSAMAALGRVST